MIFYYRKSGSHRVVLSDSTSDRYLDLAFAKELSVSLQSAIKSCEHAIADENEEALRQAIGPT